VWAHTGDSISHGPAVHSKLLPHLKVYVDSPLSVNATEIYRAHSECFDEDIRNYVMSDPNPFGFNDLTYITETKIALP